MDGIEPALLTSTSTVSESAASSDPAKMDVHVQLTTGGSFTIKTSTDDTADEFQKKIARRLRIPRERMKVLHKDQVLEMKPLKDYNITNGSKVTLLPSIKSGFSSTVQGTQQSVIQTIESLSDEQVEKFLSGSTPLTLAVSMGDHMMFIQLQLEQSHPSVSQAGLPRSYDPPATHSRNNVHRSKALKTSSDNLARDSAMLMLAYNKASEAIDAELSKKEKDTPVVEAPDSPNVVTTPNGRDAQHRKSPVFHTESANAAMHYSSLTEAASKWHQLSDNGRTYLDKLQSALLKMPLAAPPSSLFPADITSSKCSMASIDSTGSTVLQPTASMCTKNCGKFTKVSPSHKDDDYPTTSSALLMPSVLPKCGSSALPSPATAVTNLAKLSSVTSPAKARVTPVSATQRPSSAPQARVESRAFKRNIHRSCEKHSARQGCRKRSNCFANRKISTASLLLHHTTGVTGGRIARQMQRLRRLCASHQRCVAYSSREVATEISSIVRQAKHLRQSHHSLDGFSCRKTHKVHKACNDGGRCAKVNPSKCTRSPTAGGSGEGSTKTSIESLVMHGPGIFSGTYSGSLDPCVQDRDGKLKRDPKTILQLLNDLLSATLQYKGDLVDVGIIPRLLEDHFNITNPGKCGTSPDLPSENEEASTSSMIQESIPFETGCSHTRVKADSSPTPEHKQPRQHRQPENRPLSVPVPEPLSSHDAKTIPKVSAEDLQHEHRIYRHWHHERHHCCLGSTHGKPKTSSVCRKHKQCLSLNPTNAKRLRQQQQENSKIRNKMQELKQSIERKRRQRRSRKGLDDLNDSQQSSGTNTPITSVGENTSIFQNAITAIPCEIEP